MPMEIAFGTHLNYFIFSARFRFVKYQTNKLTPPLDHLAIA